MNWLLENIPLWGWAIPAGAAIGAAWWFLGFKGMIAAIGAVAAAFFYRSGLKKGTATARAKQAAREKKARDIADQVDSDIGAMPPDKRRKELGKW